RADGGLRAPLDAGLREWAALHRGWEPADSGGDRPRYRGDVVDLPGAAYRPLGAVTPAELREGCRVRRDRRPRDHLSCLSRLFPPCAGRRDGPAGGGLRWGGSDRGLSPDGYGGPARRPGPSVRSLLREP